MPLPRPVRGVFACVVAATGLGGCANHEIASRVVLYNDMAAQAHNKTMLLNILRASQRRPLEFTSLQSITGTSASEAQSELDLPIVQNGAEEALELVQHLTYSERPTYSVNVLDTQEFYQGVLKPLSTQTFDFYLKRDLSRRMLFDLFFSSVTVTVSNPDRHGPPFTAQFDNDVTDDGRFDDFQALTEGLIEAGLTTTAVKPRPLVMGPPLTPDEAVKGDVAVKAAAGGFELKPVAWCALDAGERSDLTARLNPDPKTLASIEAACATPGRGDAEPDPGLLRAAGLPQTLYRLEKSAGGANFVLCIQPTGRAIRDHVDDTCGALEHRASAASGVEGGLHINFDEASPRICAVLNRRRSTGEPLNCAGDISLGFTFTARSTYEIIRYLGEVVRRANYPDVGQSARTIAVKMEPDGGPLDTELAPGVPVATCNAGIRPGGMTTDGAACKPLFAVLPGRGPADGFVTTNYAGQDYFVAVPPLGRSGREPTLEVFQLLTELLALNRSAKDVPATSVFTIVAP